MHAAYYIMPLWTFRFSLRNREIKFPMSSGFDLIRLERSGEIVSDRTGDGFISSGVVLLDEIQQMIFSRVSEWRP